jgi:hypothetical protein
MSLNKVLVFQSNLSQRCVVLQCSCDIFWRLVSKLREKSLWYKFGNEVEHTGCSSNANTEAPLWTRESIEMDFHCPTSELCNEELTSKDNHIDNEEHLIAKKTFENIEFVVDFSCTNHVENLEEDEHSESDSLVARRAHSFEGFVNN